MFKAFISATISAVAIFTINVSNPAIADDKAPQSSQKNVEATTQVAMPAEVTTTGTKAKKIDPAIEAERLRKRVALQIKRIGADYELTDKQTEVAIDIFVDYEKQQNDLRSKITELNKEKMAKFEALLTKDQIKAKENATKNRKEKINSISPTDDSSGVFVPADGIQKEAKKQIPEKKQTKKNKRSNKDNKSTPEVKPELESTPVPAK